MEQQRSIIYTLFVAMLLTFAIIMIYNFLTKIDVDFDFKTQQLEQMSISARLIYSPDCFAFEEITSCSENTFQVHPAVLDMDKVTGNRATRCLNDFTKKYDAYLEVDLLGEESVNATFPKLLFKKNCEPKESFPVILEIDGEDYNGKLTFCMAKK